jgi:excinuclease ABC subunit C
VYYLKLDAANPDPYPEMVREVEDDGSLYFGPFQSAAILRETLSFVHEVLPLRKCTAMKPRCRPCLYNQMRTCAAPLLDAVHREKHQEAIQHLYELLDGRSDRVTAWLEAKRDRLAEALMFERASEVQRRLEWLRQLVEGQQLLDAAVRCRCVLVRTMKADGSESKLLLVAHGSVLSVRDADGAEPEGVVGWIRAHEPLLKMMRSRESELDAASVLQRWVAQNRKTVRWVAIPHNAPEHDLWDRVRYVLAADYVPSTSL